MNRRPLLLLGAALLATGCTNVPELDDRLGPQLRDARYPKLIDLDKALGPPVSPRDEAQEIEDELDARAASLQRRADQLRAPQTQDTAPAATSTD